MWSMEQQRTSIALFREIFGSSGVVNTIIIIAFYSIFFSYNQAIQINPKNYSAWNNKGLALKNLGKYSEAVEK